MLIADCVDLVVFAIDGATSTTERQHAICDFATCFELVDNRRLLNV